MCLVGEDEQGDSAWYSFGPHIMNDPVAPSTGHLYNLPHFLRVNNKCGFGTLDTPGSTMFDSRDVEFNLPQSMSDFFSKNVVLNRQSLC